MELSMRKFGVTSILILLLLLVIQPVSAQLRPAMFVTVNWTPTNQLTSADEDGSLVIEPDEERYVTAQIFIDGNVQFWAVDFNCRMGNGTQLELVEVIFPESTWGAESNDFIATSGDPSTPTDFASAYNTNGTLRFTSTRIGSETTPIGSNGVDYTMPIATIRFKVNELNSNTTVRTTCANNAVQFLDRDGRRQATARLGTFTHLSIRTGYVLSGQASRQGSNTRSNILVTCIHVVSNNLDSNDGIYETHTLVNGKFSFTTDDASNAALRDYGLYHCTFESDLNKDFIPDDQFLTSEVYINLVTPTFDLQPITIRSGDFAPVTPNNVIDLNDLNIITNHYNTPRVKFEEGDANGSGRVDASDLAIVAGNFGLSDTPPLSSEHAMYSLGTDYDARADFPNSRIYTGTPDSGAITQVNRASRTRDFWGTVSPDGKEYAYVSVNARTDVHELYIGNMTNGRGVPLRMPRGFTYPEALAPSWSPDGSLLAWICTVNEVDEGLQYNEGHICLADRRDTRNNTLTILRDETGAHIDTEIFPPAWLQYPYNGGYGYALVYSVDGQLRYYDLVSNTQGNFAPGLPTSGADMPVIINHWSVTGTTPNSYLFYRYDNGGTYELRVVLLNIDSVTYHVDIETAIDVFVGLDFDVPAMVAVGSQGGTPNTLHMLVDNSNGGSDGGVQYYDVSQSLDIMLYTDREGYNITNLYFAGAPDAVPNLASNFWTTTSLHFVDGNVGGPTYQSGPGGGPGVEWDGDEEIPTMLHAQRVTFDWLP